MRTPMVDGTVKGERGTKEGVTEAWQDGLERSEGRRRGRSRSECWPRYREAEIKEEFPWVFLEFYLPYANTIANEYMSLSFTTSWKFVWELRKNLTLFIALPRTVLSFHLCVGSQVFLSELAWHAWKCFAYFVTWFGCCMRFHIFGFYCMRRSSFWCSVKFRRWSVT